jgi:hypothetical protein
LEQSITKRANHERPPEPHHIEPLTSQLAPALSNRVVPVYLPEQHNPGSMDRQSLRQLIRDEAGRKGLKVTFEKPSV